jgi:hypothetical protein
MGKKVRAKVYCNSKSLGQELGTEVVEIDEIEPIPSSKTAAAARSKFGGLELDWLGFFERKIVRGRGVFIEDFSWPRGQETESNRARNLGFSESVRARVRPGFCLEVGGDVWAPAVSDKDYRNKERKETGKEGATHAMVQLTFAERPGAYARVYGWVGRSAGPSYFSSRICSTILK